ncbi:hypothetical protein FEM33_09630 [Dyadobacter flavalbus]|uniref:Secreted protein n=1 Tax=Dyadobacter flavalbus TaxID=2579942 RepID=A0A5M8QZX5_9BACT|nr:hypothetical protein [Dyadobacter flavalbus]KAA6439953.1 hypothetical protein FEM33_09630 [Dyadobacter flavalbus]
MSNFPSSLFCLLLRIPPFFFAQCMQWQEIHAGNRKGTAGKAGSCDPLKAGAINTSRAETGKPNSAGTVT